MHRSKAAITLLVIALALSAASTAGARMKSTKLASGVCLTEGGGRFVDIPGFPGERIDRRLLPDVRRLVRRYRIFVTDGLSTDPVHSANGEHPLGLALDIVPDRAAGGSWSEIDALAGFAEPRPGQPVAPFRWVGYDGDANHGRGHHLHLSWSHSPGRFGKPVRSVYTMRCPKRGQRAHGDDTGAEPRPKPSEPSGGTEPGTPSPSESSGGVEPRLAPAVAEPTGIDG